MELHKNWIKEDLIRQARIDVLANKEKTFEKQNRINLQYIESAAIKEIAEACGSIAWHPWRQSNSGAQIHDNLSKGQSDQTWHQDIVALGGNAGCTVWVPLDPIDGSRPSLMMAGERDALRHFNDERQFSTAFEVPDLNLVTIVYRMNLGDVLMFNWNELHATYWDGYMTEGRISLDLRYSPNGM